MLAALPWRWIFALAAVLWLSNVGTEKYRNFVKMARMRGCIANQSTIVKAIGVWESQNVLLPAEPGLWLDIATDGRVTRVSQKLASAGAPWGAVPQDARLEKGSDVLYRYVRDAWAFRCPQRRFALTERLGEDAFAKYLDKNPEVHYRWMGARGGGKARTAPTAVCLLHGEVGPREYPELVHAAEVTPR